VCYPGLETMMDTEIVVAPVGSVDMVVVKHLCTALTASFGVPCRAGDPMPSPGSAFNSPRAQYAAGMILRRLNPERSQRILGVVDMDLYVPDLNFVFGLADRGGRSAVIALPRQREEFYGALGPSTDSAQARSLFLARAAKEAVHELGHTCGLEHCHDRRCVMAFSNSLADTDYKGQGFCSRCRAWIERPGG
jgi:archaemetzincin